jgi:serine/threonine protein kinase/lipopolysaccharide biosynthesis regulator YciM
LNNARALASGRSVIAGDWHPGQTLLDDFHVEGLLGEGGMGKVHLVRSRSSRLAFAVKRAKALDDLARRNFLAELQTWIDLPDHPNLVACRFFRTLGEEILIFAEYVDGGSLREWISSQKLYEGGPKAALERMLDVAIQFAWGLHCLHELGLVHQDVKPGNVLMAGEHRAAVQGVEAKVTDYGLARAKAAGGERYVPGLGRSILVSSGGHTPAYCSPEQARGLAVTRKTDIWSWGVSVLEMFTGEVTWASGQVAAEALEQYLRERENDRLIPAMPAGVLEVLKGCFLGEPARRWESLAEVVDRLKAVCLKTAGVDYGRVLDAIERTTAPPTGIKERRTRLGTSWADPREWLERALRAEGRDPAEAEAIASTHRGSRRGELVADLAIYDEVRQAYERLVNGGHKELEADLAVLCMDKALVHWTADDMPGALGEYDRAIEIQERLVRQEGRRELANGLAKIYENKALAVSGLGDHRAAVGLYDRAIEIWERLVHREGRQELADPLASVFLNKSTAVWALGDYRAAVGLCDRAIEIRERLVHKEGRRELANPLAIAYMNKAIAVNVLGDKQTAVGLYDRAIEILERLVHQEGRRELANDLANDYLNKGTAVWALGDHWAAVGLYDRAIEILERLVHQEGRRELASPLAIAYMNNAIAVGDLGDHRAAVGLYDRAIEIWERLIYQEGRRELASELANAFLNKGTEVGDLVDYRAAVGLCDRAIEIYERLIHQEGRRELAGNLACVKANRAGTLINLGEVAMGVKEGRETAEVLRAEVARTGRADLQQQLIWLTGKLDAVE